MGNNIGVGQLFQWLKLTTLLFGNDMLVARCDSLCEAKADNRAKPCVRSSLQGRWFNRSLWFDRSLSLWFDIAHQPSKCTILSNCSNRPILRNAGEQCPSERTADRGVLPPILPEGVAGETHPSTAQQNTDSSPAFRKRDKDLGFYKGIIVALKSRKMNVLSLVLVSNFRPGQVVFG